MKATITQFPSPRPRNTTAEAEALNQTRFVPARGYEHSPDAEQEHVGFDVLAAALHPPDRSVFSVSAAGYRIVVDFTNDCVPQDVVLAMTNHGELRLARYIDPSTFLDLANGQDAGELKVLGVVVEEHRIRTVPKTPKGANQP